MKVETASNAQHRAIGMGSPSAGIAIVAGATAIVGAGGVGSGIVLRG
ncbi:MAG: hypothetical protein QOH39_1441 [Verrucomicrobiota bacterium]